MLYFLRKLFNHFKTKNQLLSPDYAQINIPEDDNNSLKGVFQKFAEAFANSNNFDLEKLSTEIHYLEIRSENDAEEFMQCLKTIMKLKLAGNNNSVEPLLYILARQNIKPGSINLIVEDINEILITIYPHLSQDEQHLAIIAIAKYSSGTTKSILFLVEKIKDFDNDFMDSYSGYEAIKILVGYEGADVQEFISVLGEFAFDFTKFRSIGLIELFTTWHFDKKIKSHPLEKHLDQVKIVLTTPNAINYSYIVSIIVAFIAIKVNKATMGILRIASNHPSLDVRIEAVYCRIYHGDQTAIEDYTKLLLDPRISWQAQNYLVDLKNNFGIELAEVYNAVKDEILSMDFVAKKELCSWLSHSQEYGVPPDEISIFGKIEYKVGNSLKAKYTVYFINYKYDNYEDCRSVIECTGYAIIDNEDTPYNYARVFSRNVKYSSAEEAWAAYKEDIENYCNG